MEQAWAWRVLGLAPGASQAEVRRAFRLAAQLLHPDRVHDLSDDVRAEAHRRMVEIGEAYRVCTGLTAGAAFAERPDGLAAEMLAEARRTLLTADGWEATRAAVNTLEQIVDAWPGTEECDAARLLLVTSPTAAGAISARERAGHLLLIADPLARVDAWDSLSGRDELAVAQVVYAHPIASDDLRRLARSRLVELGDWGTLADDPDDDIRRTSAGHLLLQESRSLAERAAWLTRRERPAFEVEYRAWRNRVAELDGIPPDLRDDLTRAEEKIKAAC